MNYKRPLLGGRRPEVLAVVGVMASLVRVSSSVGALRSRPALSLSSATASKTVGLIAGVSVEVGAIHLVVVFAVVIE